MEEAVEGPVPGTSNDTRTRYGRASRPADKYSPGNWELGLSLEVKSDMFVFVEGDAFGPKSKSKRPLTLPLETVDDAADDEEEEISKETDGTQKRRSKYCNEARFFSKIAAHNKLLYCR